MENGTIACMGSFEHVKSQSNEFSKLLDHFKSPNLSKAANKVTKSASPLNDTMNPKHLVLQEEREKGAIKIEHYKTYFNVSGGTSFWILALVFAVFIQSIRVLADLWLIYWSEDFFHFQSIHYTGFYIAFGLFQAAFASNITTFLRF
jgi:hypothetical protein